MAYRKSFYKSVISCIVIVGLISAVIPSAVIALFISDRIEKEIDINFFSYESFVRNYTENIKDDIITADAVFDIKAFFNNGNVEELKEKAYSFFSFYVNKENGPDGIYIFDNENKCIFSVGDVSHEKEALKLINENSFSNDLVVSDFFLDRYTNENHILICKNSITEDGKINKILFCYKSNYFNETFLYQDNEDGMFAATLYQGESIAEYSDFENDLISNMEFAELSKLLKIKTSNVNFESGREGIFYISPRGKNLQVHYKIIDDPDFILLFIKERAVSFTEIYLCIFLLLCIFLSLVVFWFFKKSKKIEMVMVKSTDEIGDIKLSVSDGRPETVGISKIDFYISKISSILDDYRSIIFTVEDIAKNFETTIGAFELKQEKGVVLCSSKVFEFFNPGSHFEQNKIYEVALDEFYKLKSDNWEVFDKEENIYCINIGNSKKWIKIIYYERDLTRGFVVDVSSYVLKRYKNTFDSDLDYVTGFFKKDVFMKKAEEYLVNNFGFSCLATFELSHFKNVYDIYGEYTANEYLRKAASSFSVFLEKSIIGVKSSGEFLMLVYSEDSKEKVQIKFKEWESETSKEFFTTPDGKKYRIKFMVGYCCYPQDSKEPDTLFKYSAFALYESKRLYKESVHRFSIENYNRDMFLEIRVKALDRFIGENKAFYNFQPIVNLSDGSIYGYEALLRTDDEAFSGPVDIISLALKEGKAYLLEKLNVVNCMEIAQKNKVIFEKRRLFINSLANNSLTEDDLRMVRNKYNDVRHMIVYELSTQFADEDMVMKKCGVFKKIGCRFAIDKFGETFTNDNMLLSAMPNYIKIDRSLISDIKLKKEKQSRVTKIVKFAKENNMTVIAVGVETRDELYTVMRLGVDFAQGYYLSLPHKGFIDEIRPEVKKEILEINLMQ